MCAALAATCKLLSAELISAVLPSIMELAKHPKDLVRKKAVMAVHRFEQLDPEHDGPLHNVDTYALIRDSLRDKVRYVAVSLQQAGWLPGCAVVVRHSGHCPALCQSTAAHLSSFDLEMPADS